MPAVLVLAVALAFSRPATDLPLRSWGFAGHELGARAAAAKLPAAVPAFFRSAGDQLAYLNGEPDRWRNHAVQAMDRAWNYDHYLWLENVPDGALDAGDRFTFMNALRAAGPAHDLPNVGLLPYRMLELYQRLTTEWRLWRAEQQPARKQWIEARIIHDAGILGHYVMDASNPHHASKHHNRWHPDDPNPQGYTTDPAFHSGFERFFVEAHIRPDDVNRRVTGAPRSVAGNAWRAILDEIQDSHSQVERLFRLQRDIGFSRTGPARAETRDFAAERIAVGARTLRDLWWSAWLESAAP
ncbi:MAG TPA: hypothetical protein VK864_01570 [Longimicrobiales bacterium]|nr:hypothetical protein [Longimicrobiales bacterium]